MNGNAQILGARSSCRLPPYGRELLELRKRGLVPSAQLVAVLLENWNYAKCFPRVVIPSDVEIAELNFVFLAGLDAVLILDSRCESAQARKNAAISAILECDVSSLRVLEAGEPNRWTWVKSRMYGIELKELT